MGLTVKKDTKKHFEKQIKDLSKQELKELVLINTYKLALVRSQLEAITSILIKNKLATYEEIWKNTDDNFKNTTV
ncbi:MAG: hypothetical protein ABIC91_03150 [Nanoarchaeota archaeon]|nr:hypothetical protein [Nanoarchaeota archaeon]MBU1030078.1 hypothetical protein [Nanoarchaeota archaeon]MBU1850366.1 hypothetical protein [Nanoarchaeota archaeon]